MSKSEEEKELEIIKNLIHARKKKFIKKVTKELEKLKCNVTLNIDEVVKFLKEV